MAKKVILDVLESSIGKYVKNLDTESLNVAVWSGNIQLRSLELNIDAVNDELDRQAAEAPNLAFPFRVTGGRLESVHVEVPWSRITSRPVVFRVKGLHVVVEPHHRRSTSTTENSIAKAAADRAKSIQVHERYRLQANALKTLANNGDQESFSGRLVRRIAENMQMEIEDVHIGFQGCNASAGIVLTSLSLVTTDKNGMQTFVDRSRVTGDVETSFLYKALSIKDLGVYLDETLSCSITTAMNERKIHSFILNPLTFEASLRQSDNTHCVDFPKYRLSSKLQHLSISLSRQQLELADKISHSIHYHVVTKPIFPEYRPLARVSRDTAKEWWKYAIRCIGRMNGRRSWVEFYRAFQKRQRYILLYKRMAHCNSCSWLSKLSDIEHMELAAFDADSAISIEGIMLWRNLADSLAELEHVKYDAKEKIVKAKKGLLQNLFGSKNSAAEENYAPIKLTIDEMNELESINLEKVADAKLSKESRLCNLDFTLESFKLNLSTHEQILASLSLGMANSLFHANADGSFNFKLKLSTVHIDDLVTVNSLYKIIFRNLTAPAGLTLSEDSFEFQCLKSSNGHHHISLKMAAHEMVASPLLVVEIKKFFSLSRSFHNARACTNHPLLLESLSGSEDQFYDTDEGIEKKSAADVIEEILVAEAEVAAEKLSSALLVAWRQKVEDKKFFTADFDVYAPIIIVPENCVKQNATVLVFDLGHLKVKFGNIDVPRKVRQWSESNRISIGESQLDPGILSMENLNITICTTKEYLSNDISSRNVQPCNTIMDPLSLQLDFGIETSTGLAFPRPCVFGVVPSVTVRVSTAQIARMVTLAREWINVKYEMSNMIDVNAKIGVSILDEASAYPSLESTTTCMDTTEFPSSKIATVKKVFVSFSVQRISAYCCREEGDGVEAHLVSVSASSATSIDGKVYNNLCMGWFWVLDRLESNMPRRQRLLVHSNLPRPVAEFAVHDKYDIFGDFDKLGVFSDDFAGSKELADVTAVFASPGRKVPLHKIDYAREQFDNISAVDVVLDVKFTSLFVNWNPSVLKAMVQACNEAINSVDDKTLCNLTFTSPLTQNNNSSVAEWSNSSKSKSFAFSAQLQHLEVSLNSARDDLPLIVLSMSGSRVSILTSLCGEQEVFANLELCDLRVSTSSMNPTKSIYRCLLGLAPSHSASLLTIQYFMGKGPLDIAMLGDQTSRTNCESYVTVALSPVKVVYIQAQVLTLIEYINDGVLGAITARAASSAASAAMNIISSERGEKIFSIKAVGIDLTLPQAASSERHLIVHAGDLTIYHTAFSDPGGSATRLSLSEVTLLDDVGEMMVEKAIKLDIKVILPPDTIGSVEDQTMLANIFISEASFLLSKFHYQQIMWTLDCNLGECDHFLRDIVDDLTVNRDSAWVAYDKLNADSPQQITHAGVAMYENRRQVNIDLCIELLSLELCGSSVADPLVKISAVNTRVKSLSLPNEERFNTEIAIQSLVCMDRTLKSANRQCLHLISQAYGEQCNASHDEFFFSIASDFRQRTTKIFLKIESPQFVCVPDTIAELFCFVKTEESAYSRLEFVQKGLAEEDSKFEFEAQEKSTESASIEFHDKWSISFATACCKIVFVDLGSSALEEKGSSRNSEWSVRATESIVVQGRFNGKLETELVPKSVSSARIQLEFHGNRMEAYTAYGSVLSNAVQIMEPTSCEIYFNRNRQNGSSTEVELRAKTLVPLEITFSMQNAALINAVTSSLSRSFCEINSSESKVVAVVPLSVDETARIEQLAIALETGENDSTHSSFSNQELPVMISDESSPHPLKEASRSTVYSPLSQWKMRLVLPETKVTIVNDLQGRDDALFRLTFSELDTRAEGTTNLISGQPQIMYDFHISSSLSADFFDPTVTLWKKLLEKPWAISLNSTRGKSMRFIANRFSTTFDFDAFPCCLSFSEQFLVNVNAAKRMWSIYSEAISLANELHFEVDNKATTSVMKEALAAHAARNLVRSMPYALENHSGTDVFFSTVSSSGEFNTKACPTGTIQFFRFDAPRGEGFGCRRLYGQDILQLKSLTVFVGNIQIHVAHMDTELGDTKRAHKLGNGQVLFSHISRDGKSTVLHLSSCVDVHNETSFPIDVSVKVDRETYFIGTCPGRCGGTTPAASGRSSLHYECVPKKTPFGIPIQLLESCQSNDFNESTQRMTLLQLSPRLASSQYQLGSLVGEFSIPTCQALFIRTTGNQHHTTSSVICRIEDINKGHNNNEYGLFVLQVEMKVTIIKESFPFIEIVLKPRATFMNTTPVSLSIKTSRPHTYMLSHASVAICQGGCENETVHEVAPNEGIEIYSSGASVAVSVKCHDRPVGGGITGWMKGDWVDLPLSPEFRLLQTLKCIFPFETCQSVDVEGSEFYILEAAEGLCDSDLEDFANLFIGDICPVDRVLPQSPSPRSYYVTVCNYGVDHTGDILFEKVLPGERQRRSSQTLETNAFRRSITLPTPTPFSAFASKDNDNHISLLPGSAVPIRILQYLENVQGGMRQSLSFRIDDLSICDGGIESTPLFWDDNSTSGLLAYRRLVGAVSYQSEVHIIPEFIVYNRSKTWTVLIRQKGREDGSITEIFLEPGKTRPIRRSGKSGLILSLLYVELGGVTPWIKVDDISHKVVIVRSTNGVPLASLSCQTVIGATDSKFVVQLGDVQLSQPSHEMTGVASWPGSLFANDFLRLRVRWSELHIILNAVTAADVATIESTLDHIRAKNASPSLTQSHLNEKQIPSPVSPWIEGRRFFHQSSEDELIESCNHEHVCTIVFRRLTVDWQRVFKDENVSTSVLSALLSERSQLSVIVHHVQVLDNTPLTPFPKVFDSTSDISFLDLCVRFRGPLSADLVKIDLVDLNLAHSKGKSARISVNTSEDFVWKVLDIVNRIFVATAEISGMDFHLEWDKEDGEFIVAREAFDAKCSQTGKCPIYTPPKSDKLFDASKVRISPFTVVVSFRRQPQARRYKRFRNVPGARIMNYFTTKLKFSLDQAELSFSRYDVSNLKGPAEKLLEVVTAVYTSRMKLKIVSFLSAVSFHDWKLLALRDSGDDRYQGGDIARVTGNLAGKSADLVLRKVGQGLGNSMSTVASQLGNQIENATEMVGAKAIGVGVNSVVTGLGDGVGDSLKGVGAGAGKVVKGAGQGIGQILGGVTGAAVLAGKGIGKGVTSGDGRVILGGFADGAKSIGKGLGQGVSTTVVGSADGVLTAGKGLLSGAKNLGRGFGGVFLGGKKKSTNK